MPISTIDLSGVPLRDAAELARLAGAGLEPGEPAPAVLELLRLELAKRRRSILAGLIARRREDPLREYLRQAGQDSELVA